MSDLLAIGASGVRAYQAALSVTGSNVSNAATAGYTRRTISLAQISAGNASGVRVDAIGRATDAYQSAALRGATSDAGAATARSSWATSTETALGDDATGVGQSATALFDAGTTLAANPASTTARRTFLGALDQTAAAFRDTAGRLSSLADGVASAASSGVQSVNASLDQLDRINAQLHATRAGTDAQAGLLDQRDQLLTDIAGKVGIDVTTGSDGAATVAIADGGPTLVSADGSAASRLTLQADAAGRLTLGRTGGGAALANVGGTIGGLVDSAATIADRRSSLDTMATDFATAVNAWQAKGTDANGNAGAALLTGTGAATIAVATTDTSRIAAARGGTANGNLLAMSGELRGSGGVEARWSAMVSDQGQLAAGAKSASTAATARSDAATSTLAADSGVDLDTEAANLVKYQQAYGGAAKVIQVARETLQSILDIIN